MQFCLSGCTCNRAACEVKKGGRLAGDWCVCLRRATSMCAKPENRVCEQWIVFPNVSF